MGMALGHQRGLAGVFSYLNHCRFAPLASEIQLKFNIGLEYWKSRFKFPP
jgi:hypothetical protein